MHSIRYEDNLIYQKKSHIVRISTCKVLGFTHGFLAANGSFDTFFVYICLGSANGTFGDISFFHVTSPLTQCQNQFPIIGIHNMRLRTWAIEVAHPESTRPYLGGQEEERRYEFRAVFKTSRRNPAGLCQN